VSNLAADGFTTTDVLLGGEAKISYRARINAGDPFPISSSSSGYNFLPLSALSNLSCQSSLKPSHIVLSIGGNDIRHILSSMHMLHEVCIVTKIMNDINTYLSLLDNIC
jgi:lysophospholipase L1-like esterase